MTTNAPGHSRATTHLRFGQREGVNPIPKPLQLGELSPELRAALWAITYDSLSGSRQYPRMGGPPWYDHPWDEILRVRHVVVLHKPIDEFSEGCVYHDGPLKDLFFSGTYVEVFDFLEFVMRSEDCPSGFAEGVSAVLKHTLAAYIVIDGHYIFPTSTVEETKALETAFDDLKGDASGGARSHLLKAGKELNQGNFSASIRESIHAVESMCRAIVPEARALEPALRALEEGGQLHGALKKGFGALYGFTCDEQGIRHPLLDKNEADVDRESAVFMLGACASFLSYLVAKGRAAGMLE